MSTRPLLLPSLSSWPAVRNLDAALQSLKDDPEHAAPVLHLPGFFSPQLAAELEAELVALELKPLEHEGDVAREEVVLDAEHPLVQHSGLEAVNSAVSEFAGFGTEPRVERYVFRYRPSQVVPEHQDKARHAIVVMGYLGDFTGGAYVYRSSSGDEVAVPLASGDLLICFNAFADGREPRPAHRVAPTEGGTRWVLAHSHVIEPRDAGPR